MQRPEIGRFYRAADGSAVEVRAICEACVVCDDERIFSREEFAAFEALTEEREAA